jgi:hypothetical protein
MNTIHFPNTVLTITVHFSKVLYSHCFPFGTGRYRKYSTLFKYGIIITVSMYRIIDTVLRYQSVLQYSTYSLRYFSLFLTLYPSGRVCFLLFGIHHVLGSVPGQLLVKVCRSNTSQGYGTGVREKCPSLPVLGT